MNYPAIKYNQSNYPLISTVLPYNVINNKSKTLIYGIDDGGYQRIQDERHYQNIRKYIESENFVFPNSIILAIDKDQLDNIISKEEEDLVYLNLDLKKDEIFRVVDGQHRLLGIEHALTNKPDLNNLKLQVSIIITPINKRSIEMEIFSNINSKAKRLKTDLIELAKYDFRILEERIGSKELNSHIAINTAYNLNENKSIPDNIWQNAIKIGIHSENKIGIIGVTAFIQSISGIVSSYINLHQTKINTLEDKDLILFSRNAAKEISEFLIHYWRIVRKKWPQAFLDPYKTLDIDNQYKSIIYNPNFYIQKTLGCKSVNYLMAEIIKDSYESLFNESAINDFASIIHNCKLNTNDWKLGKTLSGISSESGFRKVTKILKNKEEFVRKE
ncbi:DGQHR domain-containing protein [Tenacibaculum maritimum]|uniref:DGQHR domain-containing protein n=1 Tax=Tenacibaculum maritimum TaxID=107401 RepID=UPI0012E488B5|nr:DGQHR domain-containing protein [Tenacibaculum maritimum]CAA0248517.1 DGQHR domain-containing protein [Tenacibaculum maritimum]